MMEQDAYILSSVSFAGAKWGTPPILVATTQLAQIAKLRC